LLHLHNILVVILPRRDCAPWQVTATVYVCMYIVHKLYQMMVIK
jgi:hypothetical protein